MAKKVNEELIEIVDESTIKQTETVNNDDVIENYVALVDINKIYEGGVHAVYDFNLEIKEGEFVVFVGPSGCGKSTTLRMVAGIEEITSGDLYINGYYSNDVTAKDRNIAMVFQNYSLYPNMTVYQNMAFALKVRGFPKDEIEKRVNDAAQILGIEELLNRKPKALSGGQRQRVALGRAIVRDADLFLMDEPLSNLDAKLRVQMRSEIIKLHKRLKNTTIYVTHDQTEAMTMADRIVVMKDGYIQQIGTPIEIYRHPVNKFVASFIGSPAMNFVNVTYSKGVLHFKDGYKLKLPKEVTEAYKKYYANAEELIVKYKEAYDLLKEQLEKENVQRSKKIFKKQKLHDIENHPKLNAYLKEIDLLNRILNKEEVEVTFGIRPEDIKLNPKGNIKPQIKISELLGDSYYIHFDLGEENVIAKVLCDDIKDINAPNRYEINLEKIHLFDPYIEEAIF